MCRVAQHLRRPSSTCSKPQLTPSRLTALNNIIGAGWPVLQEVRQLREGLDGHQLLSGVGVDHHEERAAACELGPASAGLHSPVELLLRLCPVRNSSLSTEVETHSYRGVPTTCARPEFSLPPADSYRPFNLLVTTAWPR